MLILLWGKKNGNEWKPVEKEGRYSIMNKYKFIFNDRPNPLNWIFKPQSLG